MVRVGASDFGIRCIFFPLEQIREEVGEEKESLKAALDWKQSLLNFCLLFCLLQSAGYRYACHMPMYFPANAQDMQ
jgi:hypothetical protein